MSVPVKESTLFQDLAWDELLELRRRGETVLIDVRSPSEYAESTIPDSLNIPLFNDEERAEVGTLYKQESVEAAKERGLAIVSAKLPAFVRKFSEIPGRKVVFCWRGGMRSKTTATVLSLMGIHVCRLTGGYRAYRRWVTDALETIDFRPPLYVLHGHTGTGKTAILAMLKTRGYPVIDLEAIAGHRGSIFGHVGMRSHNQKTFDSLLMEDLLRYAEAPFVLIEAESSRIGKSVLPGFLIRQKDEGRHIWLEMPTAVRVRQIVADYRPQEHKEEMLEAYRRIKSRIHTPIAVEIESCLLAERYDQAAAMLLENYYDPRYAFSSAGYPVDDADIVRAQSVEEAADAIAKLLPPLA